MMRAQRPGAVRLRSGLLRVGRNAGRWLRRGIERGMKRTAAKPLFVGD